MAIIALASITTRAASLVLIEAGKACAVVVTADDPSPTAEYAAEELVWHVNKATGVKLDIVPESKLPEEPAARIFVGITQAALDAGINPETLKPDEALLRAIDNNLFILGRENDEDPLSQRNNHAGTLFGVYELLENVLQVRWLWPGELGTYAPRTDKFAVPADLNLTIEPAIPHRHIWGQIQHTHYRTSQERTEYRGDLNVFQRRHRLGHTEAAPSPAHSFRDAGDGESWWERYGEKHPEWFAEQGPLVSGQALIAQPNDRRIAYDAREFSAPMQITVDMHQDDGFGRTTWAGLYFGREDSRDEGPDFYQVSIHAGNVFAIGQNNFHWSGHRTRDSGPDFQPATWYTIEVDYDEDGSIEARLYERDSGELLSTRTHGGVPLNGEFGLSASYAGWKFDNLRITDLAGDILLSEDFNLPDQSIPEGWARQRTSTGICVSNPELHEYIAERYKEYLETGFEGAPRIWRNGPEWIVLGDRDSGWYPCRCEDCLAWDGPIPDDPSFGKGLYDRFGWMGVSDRYTRFKQNIYEKISQYYPDVKIAGYLYWSYFPAPTTDIKVSSSIYGHYTPWGTGAIIRFPLSEEAIEWKKEQWLGWRNTGISMIYRPNHWFQNYIMPHTTWQSGEFFKWLYENGMVGFKFDKMADHWATQSPMRYMYFRLFADPDQEIEDIIDEYCQAFGPAAKHVREYIDFWHQYSQENRTRGTTRAFDLEALVKSEKYLDKALEAARHPWLRDEYRERVNFLRLGRRHAELAVRFWENMDGTDIPEEKEARRAAVKAFAELEEFRHRYDGKAYLANSGLALRIESRAVNVDKLRELREDFLPVD